MNDFSLHWFNFMILSIIASLSRLSTFPNEGVDRLSPFMTFYKIYKYTVPQVRGFVKRKIYFVYSFYLNILGDS